MSKFALDYHDGLVVQSDKSGRILELLDNYLDRLVADYTERVPQDKRSKLYWQH